MTINLNLLFSHVWPSKKKEKKKIVACYTGGQFDDVDSTHTLFATLPAVLDSIFKTNCSNFNFTTL